MYAVSDDRQIYHYVSNDGEYTACGLSVTPLVMENTPYAPLHLTREKPKEPRLCKNCEDVADNEKGR